MKTQTLSFVDIFFNYDDAATYIYGVLSEYMEEMQSDWLIKELEVKLMDSGAYRAGVVFEKKQLELFNG